MYLHIPFEPVMSSHIEHKPSIFRELIELILSARKLDL